MEWYSYIALGALLFKAYWWFSSRHYIWADARWYLLMGVFITQNASEFLGYNLTSTGLSPDSFVASYFGSMACVPVAMFALINTRSRINNLLLSVMVLLCAGMIFILQFTPLVVAGFAEGTYPTQSIKGEYFDLYLIFILSFYAVLIYGLVAEYFDKKDPVKRLNHAYLIKACLPFVFIAAYVGVGLLMDMPVNGSGLFPLATSLFLLITIHYKCKSTYLIKSDPRALIPFSIERELSNNIGEEIFQFEIGNIQLSDMLANIESKTLSYKCANHSGSKAQLARRLGVSRPTLDRKLEKHNIKY